MTGHTPAELLINSKLTLRLDLVRPRVNVRLSQQQERQKEYYGGTDRGFVPQDKVFAKNHGQGDPWLWGTVTKQTGPLSYQIHVDGVGRYVGMWTSGVLGQSSPRLSSSIVDQKEPLVQSVGGLGDEMSTPGLEHPEGPNPRANSMDGLHRSDCLAKHPAYLKDYDCT